jgi:hypothetical protein
MEHPGRRQAGHHLHRQPAGRRDGRPLRERVTPGGADLDPTQPEALVYAPNADGQPTLAALEYIVFDAAWIAAGHADTDPPQLFGRTFALTPAGNRYGLDPFWSLHVWIWQPNSAGLSSPGIRGCTADDAGALRRELVPVEQTATAMTWSGKCVHIRPRYLQQALETGPFLCLRPECPQGWCGDQGLDRGDRRARPAAGRAILTSAAARQRRFA